MEMAVAGENKLLVIDLANDRRAVTSYRHFDGMTERHSSDLMAVIEFELDSAVDSKIEDYDGGGAVFVLDRGLPHHRILRHTAQLLRRGKSVYYVWPEERAVEVVDEIRLSSYRKHRAVACAWYALTRLRGSASHVYRSLTAVSQHRQISAVRRRVAAERGLAKQAAVALALAMERTVPRPGVARGQIPQPSFLDPAKLPSPENPISGRGLYIRCDYWAKIVTGGSYGHTCFLARALNRVTQDFECLMANRFELLDHLGIHQRVIGGEYSCSSTGIILNAPHFLAPLTAAFNEAKPAYVYERSVLGNRVAAQLCAARDVPYIVEYNGSELSMARSFGHPYEHEEVLEEIEAYAFDMATLINVVSDPVAQSLQDRGVPKDKILVNPNAVDPDFYKPLRGDERSAVRRELGIADEDIVIGFCGTFGGWHGIEVLAAGLPKICALSPRVKFLLIGDGNLKHLVNKAIADHGLESQVADVGLVPQIKGARYMGVTDILVATHAQNIDNKIFFGSPTKLFEYMAIGAAIVCSDLAQLGEVMRPAFLASDFARGTPDVRNERGVLITPGSVDEYVEAVARLVAEAGLRKALGRNARQAAMQNYTWDIHVENIWRHMAGLPLVGYYRDREVLD